jgi:general secretion pathway protein G
MVQKTKHDNRGFTLIELMVVVIILGILALYVGPKIMGEPEKAKRVKAKMDIATFETALKMYKLDNGVYPSTEQGLTALVEKPETGEIPKKWREGGYLEKRKVPKDPWGNEFVYISPGVIIRISTTGTSNNLLSETVLLRNLFVNLQNCIVRRTTSTSPPNSLISLTLHKMPRL